MSFMTCIAPCWACGTPFSFAPDFVPSYRDPETGEKEPICRGCMAAVNNVRRQRGQKPHPIHPRAYDVQEVHP